MRNLVIGGAAVIAAVALFVVLRPDDSADPVANPGTTTLTSTTATSTSPPPPSPAPTVGPARVRVEVRDAQPVGGVRRVTVAKGRRVILVVTSDVADHVHLHGYDVMRDVAPGRPARISFRATIVGTVEAELEDRRVPVASITTKP
ncbi:MAG: hypothetical protein M3310_04165 [Actinomycetota bacterium]|nr:hypothetical protein [Actinomycetota bacterium]